MSDRRSLPSNGRVVLRGHAEAPEGARQVDPVAHGITVPVADLLAAPGGRRERQLLAGAGFAVLDWVDDHAFGLSGIDTLGSGYVGYVHRSQLAAPVSASHRVAVRATHLYARADLKSPDLGSLSLGSRVTVTGTEGRYSQTPMGWIPSGHLIPVEALADDPVEVSARLLGTPYLWGGNSAFGIDCSGLVWLGCEMCGLRCPGDSDQQRQALGQDLPESAPLRRGDLVFWKGHVAWVADPQTILHANGHDMAVAYEPLDAAIARIAAAGDGPVTARKRLDPRSET